MPHLPHAIGIGHSSQQSGKPYIAACRESLSLVSLETEELLQWSRYPLSNDAVSWVVSWPYLFLSKTSLMGLKSRLHRNKGGGMDWGFVGTVVGVGFWLAVEWTGFADALV